MIKETKQILYNMTPIIFILHNTIFIFPQNQYSQQTLFHAWYIIFFSKLC
jgi:hypothetical protein